MFHVAFGFVSRVSFSQVSAALLKIILPFESFSKVGVCCVVVGVIRLPLVKVDACMGPYVKPGKSFISCSRILILVPWLDRMRKRACWKASGGLLVVFCVRDLFCDLA